MISLIDNFDRFIQARSSFLLLSALLLLFIAADMIWIGSPFYFIFSDAWEHTGTLSELLRSPFSPGNPHVDTAEPSARFMPLFVLAGWLGQQFSLGVFDVYLGLEIFNLTLLLLGVYLFSQAYLEDKRAPTLLLLMLLFAWGTGIVWSNGYALRSIPFVAGYPSTAAMGLVFLVWFQALRFYRLPAESNSLPAALAILLLLTLALLVHVLTGVIGIGGLILLTLTQPTHSLVRRLAPVLMIPLAVLLMELWPYYSTLSFLLPGGEHGGFWSSEKAAVIEESRALKLMRLHPFYKPVDVLPSLGIAWLAFPVAIGFAMRGQQLFAILGLLGLFGIYLLNSLTPIPLGHRALLFAVVFGQILLTAWLLKALDKRTGPEPVRAASIGVGVLCIGIAVGLGITGLKTLERYQQPGHIVPAYTELLGDLPADTVVMGRRSDTWPLPSFGGKTVALFHNNPLVSESKTRTRDVSAFFDAGSSDQLRRQILKKYHADYLFLRAKKTLDQDLASNLCTADSKRIENGFLICRVN